MTHAGEVGTGMNVPFNFIEGKMNGMADDTSIGSLLSDCSDQRAGIVYHEQKEEIFDNAMAPGIQKLNFSSKMNIGATPLTAPGIPGMDYKFFDEDSGSNKAGNSLNSRDWGWFEDVHVPQHVNTVSLLPDGNAPYLSKWKKREGGTTPDQQEMYASAADETSRAMAVTAPTYVLEESQSSQRLWKRTAGNRPPQPVEERAFFERMWSQNFSRSQVNYRLPEDVLNATSPISLSPFADGYMNNYDIMDPILEQYGAVGEFPMDSGRGVDCGVPVFCGFCNHSTIVDPKVIHESDSGENLIVLIRGDNAFGTTVSKSFDHSGSGSVAFNISIASYRVVESKRHGKYAQFLVIYREGSFRNTVGVWKRFKDFVKLANEVSQSEVVCRSVISTISPVAAVNQEHKTEHLPNAICSWQVLKKRLRWFRCLDSGYLSLKAFLLERFLHDVLFESSTPKLLRSFVGADHDFLSY